MSAVGDARKRLGETPTDDREAQEVVRGALIRVVEHAVNFHSFDAACEMADFDMAAAIVDACPEPDGEGLLKVVTGLIAARDAQRDRAESALDDALRERDEAQDWADRLAYAIAPVEVIGEHTSANSPWENALDLAPVHDAQRDATRADRLGLEGP